MLEKWLVCDDVATSTDLLGCLFYVLAAKSADLIDIDSGDG